MAGVAAAIVSHTASTAAARENVSWSPRVTERLVKLPGNFVKKAVENDFARSGLAEELANVADQMNIKRETLIELKEAIESAEGELRLELEHQLVSEKRSFINLMRDHQKIRRKKTETKIRLYSGLLRKLKNTENSATPGASALMQRQKAAKQRFEKTLSEVDKKIIEELTGYLKEFGLTEIEYAEGTNKVKVSRSVNVSSIAPSEVKKKQEVLESNGTNITSPIVGTAYLAAEPGAKKFVEIGQKIKKGQTIMIVEAMKTMNHVPSTQDGIVNKILVKDGEPVEFGQPLISIK